MPGGFPDFLELCNPQVYTPASSAGIAMTSGGANAKGSYVTVIATLLYDVCWIAIEIINAGSTNPLLVDVAIGAAGSEKVIINNLLAPVIWSAEHSVFYCFPIHIARGTRISARCQSASSGTTGNTIAIRVYDGSFMTAEGAGGVDSFGALLGTSRGTAVASSGTTNTKGSYVSMGITTRDYMGLFVGMDNAVDPGGGAHLCFDVALGAGGSQKDIIPNNSLTFNTAAATIISPSLGPYFIPIPAGTNLWVRHSASITAAQSLDYALYGIYK